MICRMNVGTPKLRLHACTHGVNPDWNPDQLQYNPDSYPDKNPGLKWTKIP